MILTTDSPLSHYESCWKVLANQFLAEPKPDSSIWRFSKYRSSELPSQGWKLHISATINNAVEIFSIVAPVLFEEKIMFKAIKTIIDLKRLNCGLFYGFPQIGKFLTVYPINSVQAVDLAIRLHDLTQKFNSPVIPYDEQFCSNSIIYYRYGSFFSSNSSQKSNNLEGNIVKPNGEVVPDKRAFGAAVPDWLENPFLNRELSREKIKNIHSNSLLSTTYKAYQALSQRGKGGVYEALDLSTAPAKICILKEGRKDGEVDVQGHDGRWRIFHEAKILKILSQKGFSTPKVYAVFSEHNNSYLAMEKIDGINLHQLISENGKLDIATCLKLATEIVDIVAKLHRAGYAWRDCKPQNLIVLPSQCSVRAIDFEGACHVTDLEVEPWGSMGYIPPEWLQPVLNKRTIIQQDLYALGATLHHLFSARVPNEQTLKPIGCYRRGIPISVREAITALLNEIPSKRPDATTLHAYFKFARKSVS